MATPRIRLEFAKQLRRLRRKRNLTQEEAAERAELDSRYYQRLESKKPNAVKIDTLEKLAKALKVRPSKLLDF
jgi:transcriptional regulator with XRE-family HTH domain